MTLCTHGSTWLGREHTHAAGSVSHRGAEGFMSPSEMHLQNAARAHCHDSGTLNGMAIDKAANSFFRKNIVKVFCFG